MQLRRRPALSRQLAVGLKQYRQRRTCQNSASIKRHGVPLLDATSFDPTGRRDKHLIQT
jgi:hypothetical protein